MSTIDPQFVKELLFSEPTPPVPARRPKQTKAHRRREARLRGASCTQVLRQHGYRQAAPLIEALVEYTAISDKLPWPSQKVLAQICGVTDRTIRRWLVICERLGVLQVFRSKPKRTEDGWSRQTNRYLLCDRRATTTPLATPLRKRRNKHKRTLVSSNPSVFELAGVATVGDDPQTLVDETLFKPKRNSSSSHHQKLPESDTSEIFERNSPATKAARALARELLAATKQ